MHTILPDLEKKTNITLYQAVAEVSCKVKVYVMSKTPT